MLVDDEAWVLKWLNTTAVNIAIPTEIEGRPVTKLCKNLFMNKKTIESVDAPSIRYVEDSVFRACTKLKTVNLPNVERIDSNAFNTSTITTLDVPKLKTIGGSCFEGCDALTSFNAPMLKTIGYAAFYGCEKLATFSDMQTVTSIGANAFKQCYKLATSINLPLVKTLGEYTFAYCSNITSINIPLVTDIGTEALYNTIRLTEVSLPSIKTLGKSFLGNSEATTLTLGGPGKPITNTDNFNTEALSGWSPAANVIIYVSDPSNPPTLTGSPWGKLNATIAYEQA